MTGIEQIFSLVAWASPVVKVSVIKDGTDHATFIFDRDEEVSGNFFKRDGLKGVSLSLKQIAKFLGQMEQEGFDIEIVEG